MSICSVLKVKFTTCCVWNCCTVPAGDAKTKEETEQHNGKLGAAKAALGRAKKGFRGALAPLRHPRTKDHRKKAPKVASHHRGREKKKKDHQMATKVERAAEANPKPADGESNGKPAALDIMEPKRSVDQENSSLASS